MKNAAEGDYVGDREMKCLYREHHRDVVSVAAFSRSLE